MTDRESVIATLQHCASAEPCTEQKFKLCPYRYYDNCAKKMAQDVLELMNDAQTDYGHSAEPATAEEPVDSGDGLLSQPIEWLDLSVRSYHCLKRSKIDTVRDLTERTAGSIMCIRNLGRKSLDEIRKKLSQYGLGFVDGPKKHATWLLSNKAHYVRCSNCGAIRSIDYNGQWCPGCGAKMDGSVAK